MSGIDSDEEHGVLAEHADGVLNCRKGGGTLGGELLVAGTGQVTEVEHAGFDFSGDELVCEVVGRADQPPVVGTAVLTQVLLRGDESFFLNVKRDHAAGRTDGFRKEYGVVPVSHREVNGGIAFAEMCKNEFFL